MYFGTTYAGKIPIDRLVEFIRQEAVHRGFNIHIKLKKEDRIVLHLTQTAPWYLVLIRRLPQNLYLVLDQTGEESKVSYDVKYSFWYALIVLLLCAFTGILFLHGVDAIELYPDVTQFRYYVYKALSLFVSLIFFFVNFALITAGHGKHTETFWEAIRSNVEDSQLQHI